MSALRPRPPVREARARTLAGWLDPLTARVREEEVRWLAARRGFEPDRPRVAAAVLVEAARESEAARRQVFERADGLRAAAALADPVRLRQVLARHLRATVTDPRRLRGDLRALDRHLDLDALLEREAEHAERHGTRLEVALRALGGLVRTAPAEQASPLFTRSGAMDLVLRVAEADPRVPTRRAAVEALAETVVTLLGRGASPDGATLRLLQRLARDEAEDPWVRRAALGVTRGLQGPIARHWLQEALGQSEGREPFLLRARAVELACDRPEPEALALLQPTLEDPSELVRFTLAEGLGARLGRGDESAGALLERLCAEDPEARVRARGVAALEGVGPAVEALLVDRVLDAPLVASFAIDVAIGLARGGHRFSEPLREALREVREQADPPVARRAALALLCEEVAACPARETADALAGLRNGETRTVRLAEGVEPLQLARCLVPQAAVGYGFWLQPLRGERVRVTRGDVLRPYLWRILHELRHPGPGKRQVVSHAVGRADAGAIRVPPGMLAEESATGVPGQRVKVGREEGWAPVLPMVDDYLHAASGGPVTVVSAEGTAVVQPPPGLWGRLRARLVLTWRYARLDALRLASLAEGDPALRGRYVQALGGLGFRTRPDAPAAAGPWGPYFASVALDPVAFLVSMKANTLAHLGVVVLLLVTLLLGRVSLMRQRIRRSRRQIPLVIGGWGTRGKSGTERLKAGLLEGLGVPVLSKTTGCEAMVLHAPPGGRAMELFLFRPFDKATIWEQAQVITMAPALGARAMLWECMALNPLYVDMLQHRWMRDDLSTITNAYPDHEDIQGPTGMDVAEVLAGFSPPDALLVTTEENMLPVIEEVARRKGASVRPVRRADRELVATDLLQRMPHVEHPANAALAAEMGALLGVPRVEAIGLMAEHVLPDLGALSVSPPARHLDREAVFVNGMSANDTLSFRHNWRQVGFAAHDHESEPHVWLVTVVNNRADRVARSRVFAHILAREADAHAHVFIGTNQQGLVTYLEEAVAERLAGTVLGDRERVGRLFRHLRISDAGAVGEACAGRLGAPDAARLAWRQAVAEAPVPAPSLEAARAAAARLLPAAEALQAACEGGEGLAAALVEALARHLALQAALDAPEPSVRALYRELVLASVHRVEDPHASGDRVIAAALSVAPPGAEVRMMGAQNIKGTGLDFAYQWVHWRELHRNLRALRDADPEAVRAALSGVEANPLGNALACEEALRALAAVSDGVLRGRVEALRARIERQREALLRARAQGRPAHGRWRILLRLLEGLLDPFDAILRRRKANRIFRDLQDRRISHPRAQALLKDLTARQKGGWLARG